MHLCLYFRCFKYCILTNHLDDVNYKEMIRNWSDVRSGRWSRRSLPSWYNVWIWYDSSLSSCQDERLADCERVCALMWRSAQRAIPKPHVSFSPRFRSLRCIKASFYIPENRLNFSATKCFIMIISTKLVYQFMSIFLKFLNNIKSSSSTASRELRQQFAACSGWWWQL